MEHYKKDLANNIIALASARAKEDPNQLNDDLFRHHIISGLGPEYKRKYGKKLKYGSYEEIIKQVEKDIGA